MSDADQRLIAGRYAVARKLGDGRFGPVLLATDRSAEGAVVVKLLRDDLSADRALRDRFVSRGRAAAEVTHPNLVTVHDVGQDEAGAGYVAMEFVDGHALDDVLAAEGRLPWRRALHVVRQVAAGLAAAHEAGFAHGDVTPRNIMLTSRAGDEAFVKLLDLASAGLRLAGAGEAGGNPSYMAPEQLEGGEVTVATDAYAVGVLLFRMVTGELPFVADTVGSLLTKHLTEAPARPSRLADDAELPPEVDTLVLKCLAKRPDERPRRMRDVVAAIDAANERQSTVTVIPEPAPAPAAAPSAGLGKVLVVGLLLLGAGTGAVLVSRSGSVASPRKDAGRVTRDASRRAPTDATARPDAVKPAPPDGSSLEPVPDGPQELPPMEPGPPNGLRLDGMPLSDALTGGPDATP